LGEITGALIRHQYSQIQTTGPPPSSHNLPNGLETSAPCRGSLFQIFGATMPKDKKPLPQTGWNAELALLEHLRWSRKEFQERVCTAAQSKKDGTLETLRLEATYQLAEFLFLIRGRHIETEADIQRLAELHNQYIVDLMKDPAKMERMGLNKERALDSMFTSDTLPRLLQNWRDRPGAIDQSNLARLLMSVMSTETCRKVIVACAEAGFIDRTRTPYGTMLVQSKGTLEDIFGSILRDLRSRIQHET
jgi:hypothetical protein